MMTREQYEIQKYKDQRRAYLASIEPIVRYKIYIDSISMPKITIYPDGHIEREYPQWALDYFKVLDEHIEHIAKSFGDGERS
jgi:hypothetical protein